MLYNKRAQTATEYMIILAVVIIIALIVVGVMGGIPGVGGGARGRASASYWQTADVGIVAYSISAGGTTNVRIRNNLGDTVTIDDVNLSTSGSTHASLVVQNEATTLVLAPGETATVTAAIGGSICSSAGDAFSSAVWINYTNQETGAVYTFQGEGNKLEGTCAE